MKFTCSENSVLAKQRVEHGSLCFLPSLKNNNKKNHIGFLLWETRSLKNPLALVLKGVVALRSFGPLWQTAACCVAPLRAGIPPSANGLSIWSPKHSYACRQDGGSAEHLLVKKIASSSIKSHPHPSVSNVFWFARAESSYPRLHWFKNPKMPKHALKRSCGCAGSILHTASGSMGDSIMERFRPSQGTRNTGQVEEVLCTHGGTAHPHRWKAKVFVTKIPWAAA